MTFLQNILTPYKKGVLVFSLSMLWMRLYLFLSPQCKNNFVLTNKKLNLI